MADIVLATLNARYIHAAFGLRYLLANMGRLKSRTRILEFDINQRPIEIAEKLLQENPRIIGLGIYIWNATASTELVSLLKALRPDIRIVLGGPEVSHEYEAQEIVRLADHLITGEADLEFGRVCGAILNDTPPSTKVVAAGLPTFKDLALPYEEYTHQDLAHRIVYVEASRGCPFSCEFCLSSLDIPVRQVSLPVFLEQMQRLLDRGLKRFKFVDRTFNLSISTSRSILEFFLQRHQPGHFYHFELVPDRLPEALREVIRQFPPGSLQFEVGIQTFNPDVGALIQRKQNYSMLEENLRWLRQETGAHIHADLIAGLPGETRESFAAGFDRLLTLRPHEIQVGILKRLRGTPIARHDREWGMIYSPLPPYEILQNRFLDFETVQKLRRFARYWDLVGNSGNFLDTLPLFWSGEGSPFGNFMEFSQWLYQRTSRTDSIALPRLSEAIFAYLTGERQLDTQIVAEKLAGDYCRPGRRDVPEYLRPMLTGNAEAKSAEAWLARENGSRLTKRQDRHLGRG